MHGLAPPPDIVVLLLQDVEASAVRHEVVLALGAIPISAGHDPAAVVVIDVSPRDGRGAWAPGLWWPDEHTPRWSDEDRPLRRDRVALPVHPDDDGAERLVRVVVRLRPLGPLGRVGATFSALVRFPV